MVPDEQRLGEIDHGFFDTLKILDRGRIGIGAWAVGIGRAALRGGARATPSSGCSSASPSPSSRRVQHMLADMATELDAARLLVWRAAWMQDQAADTTRESSIAKYYAARAAMRACNAAVQIHGGYGYTREFPVERYLRDVKLARDRRGHQRGAEDGHRPRAAEGRAVTEPRQAPRASGAARAAHPRRRRAGRRPADARPRRRRRRGRGGAARRCTRTPGRPSCVGITGPPGRRQVDAGRRAGRRLPRARASGWGWWRSIPPARSPAGPSWATASACSGTRWTTGCSSARWPPAGSWAACRARPPTWSTVLDAMGFQRGARRDRGGGAGRGGRGPAGRHRGGGDGARAGRRGAGASRRACWRSPTCSWSTRPTARAPIGRPAT